MANRQHDNYNDLIHKLDQFTRKYYLNQIIRGSLYWIGLTLLVFLLYNVLEHNYYFSRDVRKVLLISFIAISGLTAVYWIFIPLLRVLKLGRRISHDQAAKIIGEHFAEVKDKLLNILQLQRQAAQAPSPQLALASIQQKTDAIRIVPFRKAIDLSQNRKYLRYALPPLLILLVLLLAAPSVIRDSTKRIIRNNEDFERAAPFHFTIQEEDKLQVVQYEDFVLHVEVEGPVLPNEVFINVDDYQYRLKKVDAGQFIYKFKNVHKGTDFNLFAGPVTSREYTLSVLKKPNLLSFDVRLDYPSYTGRRDEQLANIGDLVVPTGTMITWDFSTSNTDALTMQFGSQNARDNVEQRGTDLFSYRQPVHEDLQYTLYLANAQLDRADSIQYNINVIPDLYPKISVEQIVDSTDRKLVYFVGNVADDYGIRNLTFNYQISNEQGAVQPVETFPLSLKNTSQFQYDYTFDINDIALSPGQQLTYYFEVFDNDAINGSKSSKTGIMQFRKPSIEEFEKIEQDNNDKIEETLRNSMKESQKLRDDLRKMREKLLQEKDIEWQNKKELERLMERQKDLQKEMQNAQNMFEENLQNQQEYKKPSEELLEKQEKLNEFFEDLMDEEMQEMMEKLREMLDEMEKKDALEMLENFELNEEELQKELDRLMELFKQLEFEQELQEQIQKLEELAEQEEELSEKTGNEEQEQGEQESQEQESAEQKEEKREETSESLQQEQQDIRGEFDKVRKDMESLEQKNKELEQPRNLEGTDEQMERIDQDMENSMQQLQQNQKQKASESQKNAAQRMRDLAQQMSAQMMQMQMQQMQADLGTLRQLLENLITLSFDQEDILEYLNDTRINTPRYISLVQSQFKVKDDFKVVEDTLQALSKRVMQIESFVSEKVTEVKTNLKKSLDELEERKKATAADHQQRTMTNMNDLALMLSEVMNQMQQQMSMMMPGAQMCNMPMGEMQGKQSGRVPLDKITEGQQNLNEDMKGLKKGMQEGDKATSEQFARLAARQAALRKALRELQQQKQQRGQGDPALENTINEMDKIETELVNKTLTNEMLKRQQEILTRLLDAEKAEREREMENQRQAETAKQVERKLPPSVEEYIKKREAEIESFQTVSPALRPYYKFLVEEYYDALKKQ